MKTDKKSAPSEPTFEEKLVQLESIVQEMDSQDIPLERAMELYERGVSLRTELIKALGEAQQRIEVLARQANGETVVEPFESENGDT